MIGSTMVAIELGCEREGALEEMEELVLGTLSNVRAREAETHRATCASCAEAHRLFAEERALFTSRAAVRRDDDAPPLLETRCGARSFLGRKLPSSRDLWSVTRVAAAALACAAAIVCVVRDRSLSTERATTTTNQSTEPETHVGSAMTLHASTEEGLACAYPASGFSRASLASHVPAHARASSHIFASNDVGVCEESPAISSGP